ncbi:MAG: glycosyltransferase [Desulfovibrio sp.]|jgi:glycosyltransferase involved in cell wall biosynthesis|nr:glycosyltransferase [Desulfovibrio sp.]
MKKILLFAHINKGYPQLLRKMNAKLNALRHFHPNTQCCIVGDDNPDALKNFDFTYINAVGDDACHVCCNTIARAVRPDIIYYRYPLGHIALLDLTENFPVIFEHNTIEEAEMTGESLDADKKLGPKALAQAAGIVCVTPEIARYERGRSRQDLPVFILPNCLAEIPDNPIRRPPLASDGELHMVMAARFNKWHGADRLIRGIARDARKDRYVLHLVGDGSALPLYKQLISKYGLEKHVLLHGWLESDILYTLYNTCHVAAGTLAIHRNKGMTECTSIKLREYAAQGLPFIYLGSDPDFPASLPFVLVVPDNERAVDMEEIDQFARKCLSMPALCLAMRAYAKERLTYKARAEAWVKFLLTAALKHKQSH